MSDVFVVPIWCALRFNTKSKESCLERPNKNVERQTIYKTDETENFALRQLPDLK